MRWVFASLLILVLTSSVEAILPLHSPLDGDFLSRGVSQGYGVPWCCGDCPDETPKIHNGRDVAASAGENVYAVESGTVKARVLDGGWRYCITIQHSDFTSVSWHIEPIVNVNDVVSRGQKIGTVANLGGNTHFHLGVRNGTYNNTANRGALPVSICGGDPAFPENFVNPGSLTYGDTETYSCQWVLQSPNESIWVKPGDERTFWVKYRNTGTATWLNYGGVGEPRYVELRSVMENGSQTPSWLRPVDWVGCPDFCNSERVTSFDEGTVGPNQVATFTFVGRVPNVPSEPNIPVYFRPFHGSSSGMQDWGGMHYLFNVDADDPQAPPNLVANPSGCTPTNSFTFTWGVPSDPGGSGIEGYAWKVNGNGETWTMSRSAGPLTAPNQGWNTFYVRAKDNVGNWGGYSSVQFCWQPPNGPNLSFEDDVSPQDGVPDGWTVLVLNGAGYDRRCNGGANNTSCYMRFANYDSQDWSAIGRPASGVFQSGIIYRLSFWYRTSNTAAFSWQLSTPDLQSSINVLNCTVSNPLGDGVWHRFWGAPFMVDGGQISSYPFMRFLYGSGIVGVVDIDDVVLEQVELCQ